MSDIITHPSTNDNIPSLRIVVEPAVFPESSSSASSSSSSSSTTRDRRFTGTAKKRHGDSCAACATGIHVGPRRRGRGGRVSLARRTSFPVGPGKSIQRLRHDVQHPRRAPERSTVITILHVTLSAHPTMERRWRRWRRRANERWQRRRRTEWRMWTLTASQYSRGHTASINHRNSIRIPPERI